MVVKSAANYWYKRDFRYFDHGISVLGFFESEILRSNSDGN